MGLRLVNSLKHIIDTNGGITGGTPSTTDVITTVDNPAAGTSNQCSIGSRVNAIFLNVQIIQVVAAGGVDNIYLIVYKNPGGDLLGPNVDGVGVSDDRKRVLHQEMVMTGNVLTAASAIPKTLFKGVVLLPKAIRRNGVQDKLQVIVGHRSGEATQQSNFCLQCIYKEFR